MHCYSRGRSRRGKGKWVQVRNAREHALSPPSPYNAFNLSDALATALQALWLRTDLVELVEHTNKQLKVKPFRRSREPPWSAENDPPLAFSCLPEEEEEEKKKLGKKSLKEA